VSAAPDYAQPLEGWRVWLVADLEGDARLVSVVYHVPWPARRALAGECLARELRFPRLRQRPRPVEHTAPQAECACGIYATRELNSALEYLADCGTRGRHVAAGWPIVQRALGRVHLWGKVVECDVGWRGALAYPERLFLPERTWNGKPVKDLGRIALSLADYGVQVRILDGAGGDAEIEAAVREHAAAA
jgi:hypothetical protein